MDRQIDASTSPDGDRPGDAMTATGSWSGGDRSRSELSLDSSAGGGIVLGDYEVVDRLGAGGMGLVYRARQRSAGRMVAIKIIRPDRLAELSPESRAETVRRFQTEAQSAARLQHDHIVTVYEVGESEGKHFYSMQYVPGPTLSELLRQGPLEGLAAARLLEPVARAVQYAHENGILHRDLKPRNILLQEEWSERGRASGGDSTVPSESGRARAGYRPYVADFGLAKAIQDAGDLTLTGQLVGTPDYMSPEQVRDSSSCTAASDVYSLGATLYELLTGRPPFRAATPVETLRQVIEQEPVAPRHLNPGINRDLETITLKCLNKLASKRYPSAAELADDLRRVLEGVPIKARPVSFIERAWRWSNRNRWAAAALASILFASISLAVATLLVSRKNDELAASNLKLTDSNTQLGQAYEVTLESLRSLTNEVVEQQMARRASLTDADRDFLRTILGHYQRFADVQANDADARSIRCEGLERVARLHDILGETEAAESTYRAAIDARLSLADEYPQRPDFRHRLAISRHNLAYLQFRTSRFDEAEAGYRDALATARELVELDPANNEYQSFLATTFLSLGGQSRSRGRTEEAEDWFQQAIESYAKLVVDSPENEDYLRRLAQVQNNLGLLLHEVGRLVQAEAAFRSALALEPKVAARPREFPDVRLELSRTYRGLADTLEQLGRGDESESAQREAIRLQKQLAADFPTRPDFKLDLAVSQNSLGIQLSNTSKLTESESLSRDSIALLRQLVQDFPNQPEFRQELAVSINSLAVVLFNTDRTDAAEEAWLEAIALRQQLTADFPDQPKYAKELAGAHINIGTLYMRRQNLAQADQEFREATSLLEDASRKVPNRPDLRLDLALALSNRGMTLMYLRRLGEAEEIYREAITIQRRLVADSGDRPEFRQHLARGCLNLGAVLLGAGDDRLYDAEAAFREAIDLQRELAARYADVADFRNEFAGSLANLSQVLARRAEFMPALSLLDEAEPHHQAALRANPASPNYRHFHMFTLLTRIRVLASLADGSGALAAVDQLLAMDLDSAADRYNAACALALAMPPAGASFASDQEQRERVVGQLGDEAMKLLREAIDHGFRDLQQLKRDADLKALQPRPDFQQLLEDLASSGK